MDPDANWAEQGRLRKKQRAGKYTKEDKERLRELRQALREWIQNGGFPPQAWKKRAA